jgi:hypothetical protein
MAGIGRELTWIIGGPGTGKTTRLVAMVCDALAGNVSPERILFLTFNPESRDILEHAVQTRVGGWSGRLVHNTRMLLDRALEAIPPWERLVPLSEYQQLLWMQASLESENSFGDWAHQLPSASLAKELHSLLRQLKRGGVNLGVLKHRIESKASDSSAALVDFLRSHQEKIASRGYGDFVDQIDQVVQFFDSQQSKGGLAQCDLIVIDDLHLAHRRQWQLLELFLPGAADMVFASEVECPFFRQWIDKGYRHRLRDLGITVKYEYLKDSLRLHYPLEPEKLPQEISLHSARSALEEGLWIAEQVDRLVSDSGDIRYSDIAMICPSEAGAASLEEALRLYRIPYHVSRKSASRDARIWLRWLQWLDNPTYDNFLKLLHLMGLELPANDSLVRALYHYIIGSEVSEEDDEIIDNGNVIELGRRLRDLLTTWRSRDYDSVMHALPDALKVIVEDFSLTVDIQAFEVVKDLVAEYRAWCRSAGRRFRIGEFLDSIEAHVQWNQQSSRPPRLGDSVHLWSVPDSRGRQAKVVFLSGTNDGIFPLPYRRRSLIPAPDIGVWRSALVEMGTPADLSDLDSLDDHWQREHERFLLASSRALEKMCVSYVRTGDSEERVDPSPFLAAKGLGDIDQQSETVEGRFPNLSVPSTGNQSSYVPFIPSLRGIALLLNSLSQGGLKADDLRLAWERVWRGNHPATRISVWQPIPRQPITLPDDFAISHSKIKTYLDCPRKFYYENIMGVEVPASYQMVIGTALHKIAERIHMGKGREVFSDTETLHSIAEDCLSEHLELFQGDAELAGWLDYVMERVGKYLSAISDNPPNVMDTEKFFDVRWQEGLRFKGRIDRLDKNPDGRYGILDYKKSGKDKAVALINQFRDRDDDFQFPIYYFCATDHMHVDVGSFQMVVFDFGNSGEIETITIPISHASGRSAVSVDDMQEVRQRIVAIGKEMISSRDGFTKKPTTQCRGFFSICPHLSFCTRSSEVIDSD